MTKVKERKGNKPSQDLPLKGGEEPTFEQKKRAAYSEMGKLGGLARAKQMAERGFKKSQEVKIPSKKANSNKKSEVKPADNKKI